MRNPLERSSAAQCLDGQPSSGRPHVPGTEYYTGIRLDCMTDATPNCRGKRCPRRANAHTSLDNDINPCAADNGFDLCLFGLWHSELVECLLGIVEKGLPLGRRDHKLFVRVLHGTTGVLLRSAGSP